MARFTLSFKFGSFLMAFLLLVGCAAMGKVGFDKAANEDIKTIALLRVDEPKPINFNITTADVYQNSMGHSNAFRDAINYHYTKFGPAMVESLRQELTNKGYEVIYLENKGYEVIYPEDKKCCKELKDIQTDAEAILYIGIYNVGYASLRTFSCLLPRYTDYKPNLFVHVRLYDSRSKKVIYARHIVVVPFRGGMSAIQLSPSEKYHFSSFDQLMKNLDEAVQGIMDSQHKIAARIAEDLK